MGHLFGLLPWHIERLAWWQWTGYRDYADDYLRARESNG